ncbi:MAG: hypothetical protein H6733_12335 [Alphaproteobacteria bacterium]|nr:hypothetical protein [Alphaproteobacteria bacterium]
MQRATITLCLALLGSAACTSATDATDKDVVDTDTDADSDTVDSDTTDTTDTDTVADTDTDTDTDTDAGFTVSFTNARYKVDSLEILPATRGIDLDNDGTEDNAIAGLIAAISALGLPGDFTLAGINSNIDELILEERAIVLLEARYDSTTEALVVDVVQGERHEDLSLWTLPEFYDASGDAIEQLHGGFTAADYYETGPDSLTIPLQFYPDEPLIQISSPHALSEGTISTSSIDPGFIGAAIPTAVIMDDIVTPLVLSFYGPGTTADGFINLARLAVNGAADLQVGGQPAVSGAFRFTAHQSDWSVTPQPIP